MSSIARIRRLLELVDLLQSKRHYNARQLAQECKVSRRTIYRDIATLQEAGILVLYDEERQGYVLPQKLCLPPAELTLDEALAVVVLGHELGKSGNLPLQEPARSAAMKLLGSLPPKVREYVGDMGELLAVRVDATAPLEHARPHYDLLLESLAARRGVRILYRSLTEWNDVRTRVSPYRLLFSRRSWYVIGRSSLHRSVRTFHIGRILEAELLDETYSIPPRFSLERYLGNAWHLIREPRTSRVVVRFQKQVAKNVAEVKWHKTQECVRNEDGTLDFFVTVDGLNEISWWILGYGDQAEVLEPYRLREMIASRVANLRRIYAAELET